jgi:hypothetical protein
MKARKIGGAEYEARNRRPLNAWSPFRDLIAAPQDDVGSAVDGVDFAKNIRTIVGVVPTAKIRLHRHDELQVDVGLWRGAPNPDSDLVTKMRRARWN